MDHLLTAEKLAQHLSVRPDTIRVWTRGGIIPSIRITGKVIRYDLYEVEQAILMISTTHKSNLDGGCHGPRQ